MNREPTGRDIGKNLVVRASENVGALNPVVFAPATTGGDVAHVAVEHGEGGGRMLGEKLEQFLALAQVGFSALSFCDVLNGAAHDERFTGGAEFEAPEAVNPTASAIFGTDDAIFAVERFVLTQHVFFEVGVHGLAVVGINERGPTFDGARIVLPDVKDLVEDIGGGPEHGPQVEDVAAEPRNPLGFLQRFRELAEGALRVLTVSRIFHGARFAKFSGQ